MDDTEIARKKTGEESEKKEEQLNFDAFQGLVLERTLTEEGRIRKVEIMTRMRFLENGGDIYKFYTKVVEYLHLAVEFGPDGNDLPRERDFPPFCLVKGRVRGQVSMRYHFILCGVACACVPGSFALVRDGAEELALMEALYEGADDHLREDYEVDLDRTCYGGMSDEERALVEALLEDADDPLRRTDETGLDTSEGHGDIPEPLDPPERDEFWLRFFLRRSRLRLTEAGFLRKGQRSRRLQNGWSETRIISEEESGLPGIVLAVLTGRHWGIPRILACGAPAPEAAFRWQDRPLGSHGQGWYEAEAFCAVSIGSAPRILEGRITVPEERLPDLFAWIRANRGVLFHLYRMDAHRAATWPLPNLRALADCPVWTEKLAAGSDAFWVEREHEDAFWAAVERTLGDALRTDEHLCVRLWSALSNTTWLHGDGLEAHFGFDGGVERIAKLRGEESDATWCQNGGSDGVHSEIALALEPEGWFWGWDDEELFGYGEADCDIRNDYAREYRERRDYFSSEIKDEIALRRVERAWNTLTRRRKT
jgi:hypothetical protein